MSNQNDYKEKIEVIKAIENKNVKWPGIPVDIYLQEAEYLYHWAGDDAEKLQKAGLDKMWIEDLPKRAGACREAQSIWFNEQKSKEEAEMEWNERAPEAYNLRNETIHAFRYAFRKDALLLSKVAAIRDGDGNADMIQDLNDLSVLGLGNIELVKKTDYETKKLKILATEADELASLLGKTNREKQKDSEVLLVRNKAYTYLKQAVDEVRDCGKYVFWRNPDRLKGYRSDYLRKNNIKRNKQ